MDQFDVEKEKDAQIR